MAIVLLLICFVIIFINTGIFTPPHISKREILLRSALVFSALVVLITELLSAFQAITFYGILFSWLAVALAGCVSIYVRKQAALAFITGTRLKISQHFSGLSRFEKFLLWCISIILVLVFIQGIAYPPNNWDSMYYHMARIVFWISHHSLQPYPTHMITQIYQPPFAEYVILNFNLLNGADYFSNMVQFLFFIFSLTAITLLVKSFGLNRRYQLAALFLCVTIPEAILQASTTQNDIVAGFFIIAAYYFALKAATQNSFSNFLFLGLAGGIAVLTKGTAYIYICPMLILGAGMFIRVFKTKSYQCLGYTMVTLGLFLAINASYYHRNYNLNGTLTGVDKEESKGYSNQKRSPLLLLSNVVKNAGLHMGIVGTDKLALAANKVVYKFHEVIGVDPNQPGDNLSGIPYSSPTGDASQEDNAPNFINFWLLLASVIIICWHSVKYRQFSGAVLLLVVLLGQILVFCYVLRWQPWNTRLQTPLFILSVPLICYALSINKTFERISYKIVFPLLLLYIAVIVLHNVTRPFISVSSKKPYFSTKMPIFEPRFEKYFANQPDHYPEYAEVVKTIHQKNYKNIGLIMGHFDYQYPLFTDCYTRTFNPVSIGVNNFTNKAPETIKNVDCIVSTNANKPFIDYNNWRYYNTDSKNKFIYLYELSPKVIFL